MFAKNFVNGIMEVIKFSSGNNLLTEYTFAWKILQRYALLSSCNYTPHNSPKYLEWNSA